MKDNQMLPTLGPVSQTLQAQTTEPARILVVDDDSSICELSARALRGCGYEVETAMDGAGAWEALSSDTDFFDLLITDQDMPRLSGVELLRKMRAARMVVPVIMSTGAVPREQLARSPWLRPTATLLKPYTLKELLGVVREVLLRAEDGFEPAASATSGQSLAPADVLRF